MYKLYNFEAIFVLFLQKLKLSKKSQKRHLVFFRSFINWLNFNLKVKIGDLNVPSFLPYLSKPAISKYRKFLIRSNIPKTAIKNRLDSLSLFTAFLKKRQDLEVKELKNPDKFAALSLVDDFLGELQDKAMGKGTIRSYKSDISQFLDFLENHDAAQNI